MKGGSEGGWGEEDEGWRGWIVLKLREMLNYIIDNN